MAVISSGSFSRDLEPFLGRWFTDTDMDHKPLFSQIFEVVKAQGRYTHEVLDPGFSLPVQMTEGGSVSYDSAQQGWEKRYEVLTYGLGFAITRNMLDDGQALSVGQRKAKALKRSMMHGKETLAHAILNRAFDTTNYQDGGDGKALCTTDHPTQAGDVSNELSTASDLDEAALEQAYIDIANMTDYRGLKQDIKPRKLIVPVDLEFEACRLLKSKGRVGTANNDVNAIESISAVPEGYMADVYLTDTDAWFLKTSADDGLKFLVKREIDLETDNDFNTENALFKSVMRVVPGWTEYRQIFGSPGA